MLRPAAEVAREIGRQWLSTYGYVQAEQLLLADRRAVIAECIELVRDHTYGVARVALVKELEKACGRGGRGGDWAAGGLYCRFASAAKPAVKQSHLSSTPVVTNPLCRICLSSLAQYLSHLAKHSPRS